MDELSGKPHPLPTPLPQSLSRKCAFGSTHTLSVHIIPAAYPRAGSPSGRVEIPGLDAFQGKSTKEDRKQWLKEPMGHMFWEKKEAERVFPGPKVNIRSLFSSSSNSTLFGFASPASNISTAAIPAESRETKKVVIKHTSVLSLKVKRVSKSSPQSPPPLAYFTSSRSTLVASSSALWTPHFGRHSLHFAQPHSQPCCDAFCYN
jgi:hypothetical protein